MASRALCYQKKPDARIRPTLARLNWCPQWTEPLLRSALPPIFDAARTCTACAMSATKNPPIRLHAVADYLAAAMRTGGRKSLNCTLKRIEGVGFPLDDDLERLVIIISTSFANWHNLSFAFEKIRAPARNCAYIKKRSRWTPTRDHLE